MTLSNKKLGFTLIELMIVVAIIGILAAIAIPAYSAYQAKTKVTAGLSEISGGRTAFELKRNDGITLSAAADIGLPASTANCNITVTNTEINCQVINAPTQVNNRNIKLLRPTVDVKWACDATDIPADYRPTSCS